MTVNYVAAFFRFLSARSQTVAQGVNANADQLRIFLQNLINNNF
jgi:hypothetical protein